MAKFKVGDMVVHHYCGGSDYVEVVKVNAKSVKCVRSDGHTYATYRNNSMGGFDMDGQGWR